MIKERTGTVLGDLGSHDRSSTFLMGDYAGPIRSSGYDEYLTLVSGGV